MRGVYGSPEEGAAGSKDGVYLVRGKNRRGCDDGPTIVRTVRSSPIREIHSGDERVSLWVVKYWNSITVLVLTKMHQARLTVYYELHINQSMFGLKELVLLPTRRVHSHLFSIYGSI